MGALTCSNDALSSYMSFTLFTRLGGASEIYPKNGLLARRSGVIRFKVVQNDKLTVSMCAINNHHTSDCISAS